MLKKAGIVVATAAAGLLAVSPLAFAGDKDDHDNDNGHDGKKKVKIEDVNHFDDSFEGRGLINVNDNNVIVQPQCNDGDEFFDVIDDVAGAVTLIGDAEAEANDVRVCEQNAEIDDSVKQHND